MQTILIVVCILILLVLAECFRETHTFRTVHYHLASSKLKQLCGEKKIMLLSDLHNCSYGERNSKLLCAIKEEKPDMIVIAGDMLVGKAHVSCENTIDFMSQLPLIAPVYYGLGNHEQRMKEKPEQYGTVFTQYKEELEHSGVHFLENERTKVSLGEEKIEVIGLQIPSEYYEKLKKRVFTRAKMKALVGESKESIFQLLIAHHPSYFGTYKSWGADLTVSGHLHGGVARIPGWRGIITPQAFLFPKYSGEMTTEGTSTIVVSKGIGIHTIKLRFFNPAEIVVIHMSGGGGR